MKIISAIGCVILLLTGCASTGITTPPRTASSEEALFYIIRKDYPPKAWTGELTVNTAVAAALKENTYVKVNVPVGKIAMALKFAPLLGFSNEPFTLDVRPNETRYILLTGDVSHVRKEYGEFRYKWSLNALELDADTAKKIIEALPKPAN